MNTQRKWMVIGATSLAVIALGFVSYRKVTGENEHYQLGLRYMKASDFSAAASELRLCLQEEPTHSRAKGILAYSVLRVDFDEAVPQDQAEAKLLNEFNRYFSILSLQERLAKMRDGDGKKALADVLKSTEEQLKEQFRKKRVPFRDWVDFKASVAAATPVIFETTFQPDDLPGVASRDVAAALLVRSGADAKAADYLMERCAVSPLAMSLTLVAGEPFKKALEAEVTRKGTFIESESRGALRLLNLKQEVKDFVSSLGTVRMLTASDLPSDQQDLLEDPQQVQLTDDDNTFLVKLEALEGTRAEVLAVQVKTVPVTDQAYFTSISAFDGTARKAHCRLLWWDGSKYSRIKTGTPSDDLTAILPYANVLDYDKDTQSIAIALRKVQKVERQRTTTGTRSATRYRYEQQWDPTKYIIGGRYFGGYDSVAVPYTVDIPTEETEKWDEMAKGLTWKVFAWDQEAKTLTERWSKWSEGMVAPGGLFKKPTKPQVVAKTAKSSNRKVSTRSEPANTAPVDTSGAEEWTDFDVQYSLTLLAVRHGYRPLKGFVRDLFARNLGEDYQPVAGRSLASAEALMTRSEKSQYQRLARIRDRRKSSGVWVSPW